MRRKNTISKHSKIRHVRIMRIYFRSKDEPCIALDVCRNVKYIMHIPSVLCVEDVYVVMFAPVSFSKQDP